MRTKLKKFKEIQEFENVKEFPENFKGKWSSFFSNGNDIVLELACGHGVYTLELGRRFPKKNFIGVDVKGNRIWSGAKQALEEKLKNVGFLRISIEAIKDYFAEGEVAEIWITFPDPFLRKSQASKRLTHENFLEKYKYILKKGGLIHFKTDDKKLFEFTLDSIEKYGGNIIEVIDDVHDTEHGNDLLDIKTVYEEKHLSNKKIIYYIKFTFN